MLMQAIKSEVVSHISYIVGSKNEAVVIDPRRDCEVYIDLAKRWGTRITHVFETHRNEDYLIGSLELSKATGAKVYHGPGLDWRYGETHADRQEFVFGSLRVRALHTPGHSPDSTSYVLLETGTGSQPVMVFTGDTLFVGDVGRTDFLGPDMTPVMAGKMHDSIHGKILPLGDEVIVLPSHGAGSVCGAKISEREVSTLGIEKKTNPLLKMSREEFVKAKTAERHETPPYFKKMESLNLNGPPLLGRLPSPPALKPSEFSEKLQQGAQLVDSRAAVAYGGGHVEGAYSLPPSRFSNVGWVLDFERPILLVADDAEGLDFSIRSLIRLGYDDIAGFLAGGMEAWYVDGRPIRQLDLVSVHRLREWITSRNPPVVLDVRRQSEWDEGHIEGATHIYLGHLPRRTGELPKDRPIAVMCKTGNRSSFGSSVLLNAGFTKVSNCLGGMDGWRKSGFPTSKS